MGLIKKKKKGEKYVQFIFVYHYLFYNRKLETDKIYLQL